MTKYGYIRVSSRDQKTDRQYEALMQYGIGKEYIFTDKLSGKDFNRPQYKKLLRRMRKGDVLVIKSIDRLGRNYEEILEQWQLLCRTKGVDIEVIEFPLLNTNQSRDGLTGIFISNLTLQILAYLAQTEREFIKRRQAEGIAIALANGTRFGAVRLEIPENFEEYYKLYKSGAISLKKAAESLEISRSTFYRRCRERDGIPIDNG
ncbi:MAG: recombinase family protein [Lachnospiraceae bacterium]|nr:recombinase family protein [Lachnospiraceae bacterium]